MVTLLNFREEQVNVATHVPAEMALLRERSFNLMTKGEGG